MKTQAMNINPKLVDELLKEYKNPEDLLGDTGILNQGWIRAACLWPHNLSKFDIICST